MLDPIDDHGIFNDRLELFFIFIGKQIQKGPLADLIFGVAIHRLYTVVAIDDFKGFGVQHKYRVGDIVENFVIFLFRLFQLVFELFAVGDINAHFHGGHDLAVDIFDGRGPDNPVVGGAVPAEPGLFAVMRLAVLKGFFDRTIGAFFLTAFIGVVAVVAGLGIKAFLEFMIISEQPEIFVLNRYDAGYPFKQRLVFIALLV